MTVCFFLCNSFDAVTQVMSPMGGSLRGRRKKGRGEGEREKSAKANVRTIVRVLIKSVLVNNREFYDFS